MKVSWACLSCFWFALIKSPSESNFICTYIYSVARHRELTLLTQEVLSSQAK